LRTWFRSFCAAFSPDPPPRRPEIVLAIDKLDPAVESEMGRAMKPRRPVRHQTKVVQLEWWLAEYAPDHKRTA
jgi:hypothetical protein